MKPSRLFALLGLCVGLLTLTAPAQAASPPISELPGLYGWGDNATGQVGDGTTTDRAAAVLAGSGAVWSLPAAGNEFSLSLRSDDTLWAWGNNSQGQLGDNTTTNRLSPTQVGTGADWNFVAAGGEHSLGVKNDGTLWAWGDNSQGQLGDNSTTDLLVPTQIGTDGDWSSVAAGTNFSLAVKNDGTLWAWGDNFNGRLGDGTTTDRLVPVQIGTDTNWVDITAGDDHSLGLKTDGTLWAWGDNINGQLGDGTVTQRTAPVQVGTSATWAMMSAGNDHSLGLKNDGTLWAWGTNLDGQLGDGTVVQRLSPVQIGSGTNWLSVSAGDGHSLGLRDDGTLWAWGNNFDGELGDGSTTDRLSPVASGSEVSWYGIDAGGSHSLAVRSGVTPYPFNSQSPQGAFDSITPVAGGAKVTGWTIDPTTRDSIDVHVYVDNTFATAFSADNYREDIDILFPGYGGNHGFNDMVPIGEGAHTVCVYGIDVAPGNNALIGCKSITVALPNAPIGAFDSASMAPGGIKVSGWAIDAQTDSSIGVHVYVGNTFAGAFEANGSRPDVAQAFPGYGDKHGFSDVVSASAGTHNVCVYGINVGVGNNALIGCRQVTVVTNPIGSFDAALPTIDGVNIMGWALDPFTTDPIGVHVYVDNLFAGGLDADMSRPDVGQAYAGYGSDHGFNHFVPVSAGTHTICTYGINKGPGDNALIACRQVTVPVDPFGSFDLATFDGSGLRIAGWAIDPNTADPIVLHVYIDGTFSGEVLSDRPRPDVGLIFEDYGDDHGFDEVAPIPLTQGAHNVCVYGLNKGPGANALIGCRSVNV